MDASVGITKHAKQRSKERIWGDQSMKEYEYRRRTFYLLREGFDFPDELVKFPVIDNAETNEFRNMVNDGVQYLIDGTSYLRFPGVARATAIAVAQLIVENFGEVFFEVLNDKDLMNGFDPYFKTYEEDKEVYDAILSTIPPNKINWESERMQITKNLVLQEYMLDEEGLSILPLKRT